MVRGSLLGSYDDFDLVVFCSSIGGDGINDDDGIHIFTDRKVAA